MLEMIERLAKFAFWLFLNILLLPFHLIQLATILFGALGMGMVAVLVMAGVLDFLGLPVEIAYVWGIAVALFALATLLYRRYVNGEE